MQNFIEGMASLMFHHTWQAVVLVFVATLLLWRRLPWQLTTRHRFWMTTFAVVVLLPLGVLLPRADQSLPLSETVTRVADEAPIAAGAGHPGGRLRDSLDSNATSSIVQPEAAPMVTGTGQFQIVPKAVSTGRQVYSEPVANLAANTVTIDSQENNLAVLTIWFAPLVPWLLAVWGLIVLALWVRLAVGMCRLKSIVRDAQAFDTNLELAVWFSRQARRHHREVSLRVTDQLTSPSAVGWFKPVVLIPKQLLGELSQTELRAVILHELAHICRGDAWFNLGQRAMEAVFFFNPAVRFASRQVALTREEVCDQWAIAAAGGRKAYARCLVKVYEVTRGQCQPVLAMSAVTHRSHLRCRVDSLLTGRKQRGFVSRLLPWFTTCTLLMGLIVLSSMAPTPAFGQTEEDEAKKAESQALANEAKQLALKERELAEVQAKREAEARLLRKKEQPLAAHQVENAAEVERLRAEQARVQAEQEAVADKENLSASERLKRERELVEVARKLSSMERDLAREAEMLREQEERLAREQEVRARKLTKVEHERLRELRERLRAEERALAKRVREERAALPGGDHQSRIVHRSDVLRFEITGDIAFSPDETQIVSLSPKGSFHMEDLAVAGKPKVTVRADEDGVLSFAFWRHGKKGSPADAQSWLQDNLPRLLRDSGLEAEARIANRLEQFGVAATLDYVLATQGDFPRAVYIEALAVTDRLDTDQINQLADLARDMDSDFHKSRTFAALMAASQADVSTIAAKFDTIDSDFEMRRIWEKAMTQADSQDRKVIAELAVAEVASIDSDFERRQLLSDVATVLSFDRLVELGYLEAVAAMGSGFERRYILSQLIDREDVSVQQRDNLLIMVGQVKGAMDQRELLRKAVKHGWFTTTFWDVVTAMNSSLEQRAVLGDVIRYGDLETLDQARLLQVATSMSASLEKAAVLKQFIRHQTVADTVKPALEAAIASIDSKLERESLMEIWRRQ